MKKDKKQNYETPIIVPLGELARGLGAPCRPGSAATGQCQQGIGIGITPPVGCTNGGNAGDSCGQGGRFGK